MLCGFDKKKKSQFFNVLPGTDCKNQMSMQEQVEGDPLTSFVGLCPKERKL